MGLFNRNKHDVVPKEKDLKFVVNKFRSVSEIKLNAKVVVPNGYTMVFGKKGKVCDQFNTGEHYFNFATLPVMCRKFKIDDKNSIMYYLNNRVFTVSDVYFLDFFFSTQKVNNIEEL